jgi:hypothetical protein
VFVTRKEWVIIQQYVDEDFHFKSNEISQPRELQFMTIKAKQNSYLYLVAGGVNENDKNLFQNGSFDDIGSFEANFSRYSLEARSPCRLVEVPILPSPFRAACTEK